MFGSFRRYFSSDLAIDQAQRLVAHPDKDLAARARKVIDRGGRLPSADREAVLKTLMPAAAHVTIGEGAKVTQDLKINVR